MNSSTPSGSDTVRRSSTTVAAFLIGLPLAAAILGTIYRGPWRDTEVFRYVSHPVECVEVLMFSMAVGALFAKFVSSRRERAACREEALPPWDGLATTTFVPVECSTPRSIALKRVFKVNVAMGSSLRESGSSRPQI